jgi:hypothetical protein
MLFSRRATFFRSLRFFFDCIENFSPGRGNLPRESKKNGITAAKHIYTSVRAPVWSQNSQKHPQNPALTPYMQKGPSVHPPVRGAQQKDVSLIGVSTAGPGIAVSFHCIYDALQADWGRRGSRLIVGMGLVHQRRVPSNDARDGSLILHRLKHAINKDSI